MRSEEKVGFFPVLLILVIFFRLLILYFLGNCSVVQESRGLGKLVILKSKGKNK